MKILQVNNVYIKGSTGKILHDIHTELLQNDIKSIVCYGRGSQIVSPGVYKFCPEILANIHTLIIRTGIVLNYGGNLIPTLKLINIIKREKPDIVHIHCINGSCVNVYELFKYLALHNIKTVISHHAEFYYTGSCEHSFDCTQFIDNSGCKHCPRVFASTRSLTWDNSGRAWKNMKQAISYFNRDNLIFTAVSPWLKERSMLSPITKLYECQIVTNGVNTNIFNYRPQTSIIKNKIPKDYTKTILFVSAYFNPSDIEDNKGGYYIIKLAKLMPDALFVIVALRMSIAIDLPNNIYIWGSAKSQTELANLYRSSDITVITSKRETFSMVCAESLCCGTPIAGFKAGGPESIAISSYSQFVEYGNITSLKNVIVELCSLSYNREEISQTAILKYSEKEMVNQYINVYHKLLNK